MVYDATFGQRTQLSCITEHFGQRYFSVDLNAGYFGFLTAQHTATTAQVTDNVTSVLFRSFYFNLHDRLKQNWFCFLKAFFKGNRRSQFKRQLRGVNVVVRTEVQTDTHINYRVTCQRTSFQLFRMPLSTAGMYSPELHHL